MKASNKTKIENLVTVLWASGYTVRVRIRIKGPGLGFVGQRGSIRVRILELTFFPGNSLR